MPDLPNFEDSSQWEKVPDVAVFDEHDDRDKDGKLLQRFDRKRLEKIAQRSNKRDQTGNLCPLTLGHTIPKAPEKDQPEIVGYARKFNTAWDDRLGKWVIRATYYLKKDRAAEAKEYPRTSVELWLREEDHYFDPIALSKQTPERDVGQWTYGKDSEVLQYTKKGKAKVIRYTMDNQGDTDPDNAATPGAPDPAVMNYVKSSAKKYAKKYAKRYVARYQAGAGAPGGSNTFTPDAGDDDSGKPKPNSTQDSPPSDDDDDSDDDDQGSSKMGKKNTDEVLRMAKEQFQTELAQFQKKLDEKDAKITALEQRANDAEAERAVVQLESENFRIPDRAKLVAKFAKADAAARKDMIEEIRACYQKNPPGDFLRLANGTMKMEQPLVHTTTREAPNGDTVQEFRLDKAKMERALQYQKEKNCSWDEAVKYIKSA